MFCPSCHAESIVKNIIVPTLQRGNAARAAPAARRVRLARRMLIRGAGAPPADSHAGGAFPIFRPRKER